MCSEANEKKGNLIMPQETIVCPVCGSRYNRGELSADEVDEINAGEGCISLSCVSSDDDDD